MSQKTAKTSEAIQKALRKMPVRDLPVAKKVADYVSEVYVAVDKKLMNLPAITALKSKNRQDLDVMENAAEAEAKRKKELANRRKVQKEVADLRAKYNEEIEQRRKEDDDMLNKAKSDEKSKQDRMKAKLRREKDKVEKWREDKHIAMQEDNEKERNDYEEKKAQDTEFRKNFLKEKKEGNNLKAAEAKQKKQDDMAKELNEAEKVKDERKKREAYVEKMVKQEKDRREKERESAVALRELRKNPEVVGMLEDWNDQLRALFTHYTKKAKISSDKSNMDAEKKLSVMSKNEFRMFCCEFKICPTFVNMEQMQGVFSNAARKNNEEEGSVVALNFKDFEECMLRICRQSGEHVTTLEQAMNTDPHF